MKRSPCSSPIRTNGSFGIELHAVLLVCFVLCSACHTKTAIHRLDPDLNRMLQVPRYDAYEQSPLFDDGMAMRTPPRGTVPILAPSGSSAYLSGQDDEGYASSFPLILDEHLVNQGQDHFEHICSACHGTSGYGNDAVTRHMQRPAPSLHLQRIRDLPPGKVFSVISHGYGLMPDYAAQLAVRDRWAVVAYVKVLERSQYAPVAALPDELRLELAGRLR